MYDMCFACGKDNPISLGLKFDLIDNNKVKAIFSPKEEHQGYEGIVHGGIVSTLLDEAMVSAIVAKGSEAVTAELKIRFKDSIKVGEELHIFGYISKEKSKMICTEGEIRNKEGQLKARGEAKFMLV
ncbi:PaaI family thioesterase [Natronospora cellulosivora (SeqCode)]